MFGFLKKEVVINKWVEFQIIYVKTNKSTYYIDYESSSIYWNELNTGRCISSNSYTHSILRCVYEMYHHDAIVEHRKAKYEKEQEAKDETT